MNNNKTLVIIDMQGDDGFALENHGSVIANIARLLSEARAQHIPVVYTRHINDSDLPPGEPLSPDGGPASYRAGTYQVEILEALAPLANEWVFDKKRYSAFHQTDLDQHLKAQNIDTLIITGVLTDVCVLTTVFDAFALGYKIQLIADACTGTTLAAHYSALMILINWVYSIELFNCGEFLRALRGEPFNHYSPQAPDELAHQPADFPLAIARLESRLCSQEPRS